MCNNHDYCYIEIPKKQTNKQIKLCLCFIFYSFFTRKKNTYFNDPKKSSKINSHG